MHVLKIGNTLSASIRIFDETKKEPIVIDENLMSFQSTVKDSRDNFLANVNITIADQTANPGYLILEVPDTTTINWNPCEAELDIKVTFNNSKVVSTDKIKFKIIEAITK